MLHNADTAKTCCRSRLKSKSISKLVAKALGALDALPGAADMEIIPEHICAERSLMPWCQVQQCSLPRPACLQSVPMA